MQSLIDLFYFQHRHPSNYDEEDEDLVEYRTRYFQTVERRFLLGILLFTTCFVLMDWSSILIIGAILTCGLVLSNENKFSLLCQDHPTLSSFVKERIIVHVWINCCCCNKIIKQARVQCDKTSGGVFQTSRPYNDFVHPWYSKTKAL